MSALFGQLAAPFPPDRISWRVGSTTADKKRGLALAYIDSRDVQDRLDTVCGPENWQCRYPHAGAKTVCEIGIRVSPSYVTAAPDGHSIGAHFPGEWVWKADGAGDSDVEAEKGALSDAFKRAAVKWGIGRYLYDVASPWVELEPAGRSFKIKESEYAKLAALLGRSAPKAAPAPAKAPGVDVEKIGADALNLMADIDQLKTVKALDTYAETTLAKTITKFSAGDADAIRTRFGQRKKALKQAELLTV